MSIRGMVAACLLAGGVSACQPDGPGERHAARDGAGGAGGFAAPQSLEQTSLAPPEGQRLPPALREDLMTRLDSLATRRAPHLEGELGAVLQELQRQGTVMLIRERSQPVFHITVARDPG